jgi:hypothetical protein
VAALDKLIAHMKAKGGVWFATGEQVARFVVPIIKGTTNH